MSPAIPLPVSAGRAAPLRRSLLNWPLSASRSQDRGPHPQAPRLPAARQSQARLGWLRSRPRRTVPAAQPAVRRTRPADHQHRELVGNFKNHGTSRRQRPRALPGATASHPLRHLRPVRQPRLRGRRHLPRHPRLRRCEYGGGRPTPAGTAGLADSGGSNSPRWLMPSDSRRLGASKWNPIDHRRSAGPVCRCATMRPSSPHPHHHHHRQRTACGTPPASGCAIALQPHQMGGLSVS